MKNKFLPFKKAREAVRKMGFKGRDDYRCGRSQYKISELIPWNPNEYYREWAGWYDWLGTSKRTHLPFEEARSFVRSLKLKDTKEWKVYCESGKRPNNIPANVYRYKEFISFYDWLGNQKQTYASFKDVKELVKKLGIKNQVEWFQWARSGKKPNNIPAGVDLIYKDEWIDWYDFLGKPKNFLPYKDAIELMRELNVKSAKEYRNINEQYNLPTSPERAYGKKWKNWFEFLGTNQRDNGRIHKINYDYFKKWSPDMAYILGIMFADGHIRHKTMNIVLQNKDQYLLKQILRKIIIPNEKIWLGRNGNARVMWICSVDMVKDIVKIFEKDKKYLRHNFPKIPKKYLPDFIRGLWDGDGCVWWSSDSSAYLSALSGGSIVFLSQVMKVLRNNIGDFSGHIEKALHYKGDPICGHFLKKDSITYQLCLGVNDTRRLRDFMYSTPSDLKMIRKYKKFMAAGKVRLANKDRRKTYWGFNVARRYVRKLNLKNLKEWERYCISGNKPEFIPSGPHKIFREWKGYKDWLGVK